MILRLLCYMALAHMAQSVYEHNIMLLQYNTSTHDVAFEAAINKATDSIYETNPVKIMVVDPDDENSTITQEVNNATVTGTICIIPQSSTNPRETVNAVCKCLNGTKVSGIVGPYTSDQSLIVAYLTATLKIPTITPTASAGILLDKGDWTNTLFKISPNNRAEAIAIADLIKNLGLTRAAIVYTTDVYGMSLALYVMQQCKERDIKIATSVVLKTGSSRSHIKQTLEEDLVPYEARLVILLVPGSETDIIVTEAFTLDLINKETIWVTGDGPAHFMETKVGQYDRGPYRGMISVTPYVDTASQDMLDLLDLYNNDKTVDEMSPESTGVYYSTILLAKALESIMTPPVDTGCEAEWSEGGEEAREKLKETYYYSSMPDNSTGYNISFGPANTIKDKMFEVLNYNGTNLNMVGSWKNNVVELDRIALTFYGYDKPDDSAGSIRAELLLGINRDEPFVFYKKDKYPNSICQGNDCYEGFAIDVIEELSHRLAFDYIFVESNDGKFGAIEADGSWNGLVRMLIDKEIHAATVGFGTSSSREAVIDFSANIRDGGVFFMAKMKNDKLDDKLFFLKPFAPELWFGLIISSVVIMVIVWILDAGSVSAKHVRDGRKEKSKDPDYDEDDEDEDPNISIPETIFMVLATFLGQGGDNPRCWPSRIVLTGWWIIVLVMINTYIADLAAALTVKRMEDGYGSISDIMKDKDITWGTVDGSVTESLLRNSGESVQRELISRAKNVATYDEGVKKVRKGDFVMMYGSGPLEYSSKQDPCDAEVLTGIPLAMFGYAFAFPQNSPYRDTLNKELFELQEQGFMTEIWNKWAESEQCKGADEPQVVDDENEESINLGHLEDLMWVFVPLLILALVLFGIEWLWFFYTTKCRSKSKVTSPKPPKSRRSERSR